MQTKTRIAISSRVEAAAAVPVILGFHPSESIVIVGIGSGAPTARLDLPGVSREALLEALGPAIEAGHWSEGCLVAVFTECNVVAAEVLLSSTSKWLPEIRVLDAFRVTTGECIGALEATGETVAPIEVPGRPVAASRADLVAAIDELMDPEDILTRAVTAWKSGNGAAAWLYLDRLEEVAGWPDPLPDRALRLASLMRSAIDPTQVDL